MRHIDALGLSALVILTGTLAATPVTAQPLHGSAVEGPRVEVAATVGGSSLFVINGPSHGQALSVGLGAGLRLLNRLWLDADVNQFIGLDAAPASCGLVDMPCVGEGRDGFEDARTGAIALTYHFGTENMHLYATGGLGFIRAEGFETVTFAGTGQRVDRPITVTGWGPSVGVGLRVPLPSRWALKPEVRIYGADGPNLTSIRGSIALARAW